MIIHATVKFDVPMETEKEKELAATTIAELGKETVIKQLTSDIYETFQYELLEVDNLEIIVEITE